jgi:Transposase and inactivated derivatives
MHKTDLYKGKYRIESTRLKEWDYSSSGFYFVTICTKSQECFLGSIVDGKVVLSGIGEIVAKEWQRTEQIRKDVKLDEWVVMPNHVHGIIVIRNDDKNRYPVETHCNASLQRQAQQKNNLSYIIQGLKSSTTKSIHMIGYYAFAWQSRFYDHIIRGEKSLQKVREYISSNPLKWDLDENNPTAFAKIKRVINKIG